MGDQRPTYTPDEAISAIGFGKFQGLVLVYAGFGWISEAMEMMLLSVVGVAVQSEWKLSPSEESLLTSVVMAGTLVGAYFWGTIADAYGRRRGFIGAVTVLSIAGICCAFSPNYILLLVFRSLVGFGVGGNHVFASWFLEFIPTPNRGAWAFLLSIFWSLGTVIEASLSWIVMPTLSWRWLIALSCLPSWIVLLLSGLAPESPRHLCVKGKMEEAHMLLETISIINNATLPPGILVLGRKMNIDQEQSPLLDTSLISSDREKKHSSQTCLSSLFALFSPELVRTTLLVWFLYFANTFSVLGVILLTTEVSNSGSNCSSTTKFLKNAKNNNPYRDSFINSLADLPAVVIPAFIVDKLGRKLTMEITCILSFILLLPLIMHHNEIVSTTLLFGARMFISATFSVTTVYASEVFPTSVRTTGVGSATSIGRIGGIISPLVAVGLVRDCHQAVAIVLFEAVIVLMGFSVALLPFEISGRGLSDTVPLSKEEQLLPSPCHD
ncbi:organic cation/carnitine transporter 7-like [Coffea eugenioides]|uniref:organic cation/carnitine transporter 7-like n=1 Tax=Coffea eugenioides TaxID=49369 RepID=UPI000F61040B|nr:organic cation/carnitine transporter 7-like [Coffea eugenioides]